MHDSSTSLRPGEHAEYWKQTQKQLAMTSQKRKEPEGEQLQSLAITGPADTGDFFDALWGDSNEGGGKDGQDGVCAKCGAGKKGNNSREHAKQVRTRQPADGDARAAGRTGQEGEEPGPKRRAKAKATGTATTAVGETAKDRAGGQNTSKGLTDKGRATAFGVSEQATPPAFFEADGMASASLHTDSSSGDACVTEAIRVDCLIPS